MSCFLPPISLVGENFHSKAPFNIGYVGSKFSYSQVSNKRAGWNKRAGCEDFFVCYMKKLEIKQMFRLLHEKLQAERKKTRKK